MNRLTLYTAVVLAAATLAGCGDDNGNSNNKQPTKPTTNVETQQYLDSKVEIAQKGMKRLTLENIAGIYAGTVQVTKTEKGYESHGSFNPYANPEMWSLTLKRADQNQDGKVTLAEAKDLEMEVMQKYAK